MINEEEVLKVTGGGSNIYSHIFSSYYPNQIVMELKGLECKPTLNHFNSDKPTLKIWTDYAAWPDPSGDCFYQRGSCDEKPRDRRFLTALHSRGNITRFKITPMRSRIKNHPITCQPQAA